jgi:hypothetical protein
MELVCLKRLSLIMLFLASSAARTNALVLLHAGAAASGDGLAVSLDQRALETLRSLDTARVELFPLADGRLVTIDLIRFDPIGGCVTSS